VIGLVDYYLLVEYNLLGNTKLKASLMAYVDRNKYHELNNILWDTRKKFIAPEDALALYERRWGYIDKDNLDNEELALIKLLTEKVGNGQFMPAA
jgi:hypothetical protein